jgi:hypothetical protein
MARTFRQGSRDQGASTALEYWKVPKLDSSPYWAITVRGASRATREIHRPEAEIALRRKNMDTRW